MQLCALWDRLYGCVPLSVGGNCGLKWQVVMNYSMPLHGGNPGLNKHPTFLGILSLFNQCVSAIVH